VDGFGVSLPAGTVGTVCEHNGKLERLAVDESAYVTVEGLKLTAFIDFDCGPFLSGTLFENSIVGGKQRQRGEVVSRTDLSPK
jgi:hypothetical protein